MIWKWGAFLIEKHKKKVNDEIRQRKQEKKLRDQLSTREVSSTPLSDNNMSKISVGPPCQNSHRKKVSLAQLFNKRRVLSMAQSCYPGRDLLWYYYEEEFLNQDRATTHNNKGEIGEKKANGMIYDKILEVLLFFVKKRSEETGLRLPEDTPAKAEEDDPFIKIFEYLEERQNETDRTWATCLQERLGSAKQSRSSPSSFKFRKFHHYDVCKDGSSKAIAKK
ncbi:hypothetical protein RhiirA5_421094 [Rhizophagus irregularis]|uniref:Uncharacterized protein n=1 Tax=Rhizophagus irregularis TaxID=588596 RepID=A0A2N0PEN2_9GLOM|nr:hypothetical protein RhiirA5_421094 [Rhizophagus irregularis]